MKRRINLEIEKRTFETLLLTEKEEEVAPSWNGMRLFERKVDKSKQRKGAVLKISGACQAQSNALDLLSATKQNLPAVSKYRIQWEGIAYL